MQYALCPVFCGAALPYGAMLWCPAVRIALLAVLVCVLSLCLRCCVELCLVVFSAGLICAVVGASFCGVSPCVVLSPLAFCGVVVLPCCVVWCGVVVLCRAVFCGAVLPCGAVLLGWAVCHYCHGGCSASGCVCAALAAGLGGQDRCRLSLLPLGPSLPSRPSRCVLLVVPSGCPFPSPAGTPFHAVSAFRGLDLVALRVRAACPLGVRALVLLQRTAPPGSVWRAHYARVWCRAPVQPFNAVRASPRLVPRSLAPPI